MTGQIDPLLVGKMIQQLEHLSDQLEKTEKQMETLAKRLEAVEEKYRFGKAAAFGALLVLGAAVYGVKDMLGRALGALAP